MLKDRKALLESELRTVHRLASKQFFDIALFATRYSDPEYAVERIAYETTLAKYDRIKTEIAEIDVLINNGNP